MIRMLGMTLLCAMTTLGAAAAAEAGAPTEEVRRYTDQVQQILDDRTIKAAEKRAAVRKVAEQVFDMRETARRALGPHWTERSPAEQQEFAELFADLLEQTYIGKIDLYGGERLQYTSEAIDGDYAIVRARVLAGQAEIPVEARMLAAGTLAHLRHHHREREPGRQLSLPVRPHHPHVLLRGAGAPAQDQGAFLNERPTSHRGGAPDV